MIDSTCEVCGKSFQWGADEDSAILDRAGGSWLGCRENAHWKLTFHIKQEHPSHGFFCPHRGNSPLFREEEFKDFWHLSDGYRACSYCGSMHPDDLFAVIEGGGHIAGTDKNYKIYVDAPSRAAGNRVVSSSSRPFGKAFLLTEESLKEHGLSMRDMRNYGGEYVTVAPVGPTAHLKFYYQHLDEAGRQRFIALYNERKMNLDEYGLYVAPYFASKVDKSELK